MTNTENYGFFLPTEEDSMADVQTNLTSSFETLEAVPEIPVFAAGVALPQSGPYEIGDRIFRNDALGPDQWPSSYILVCKDINWGWHWRPIQVPLSPWVTLTNSIIDASQPNFMISPTVPLSMAMDYKGRVWWRGAVEYNVAGIPVGTKTLFKPFPSGIKPNSPFEFINAVSPVTSGGVSGVNSFVGAIMHGDANGSTFQFWNTAVGPRFVFFDGFSYIAAESFFSNG